MKIYKYRDLSQLNRLERIYESILENKFWCPSLDRLNDPDEFKFKCDYTETEYTVVLMNKLLKSFNKPSRIVGQKLPQFENIAKPIIDGMVGKCRKESGLVCFSLAKNKGIMWERYGGNGNGLCIEIDVPDDTDHLYKVNYVPEKVIHIDTILKAHLFKNETFTLYRDMLLTKTTYWQPEDEIRIVTNTNSAHVHIKGSVITEVMLGNKIEPDILSRVRADIESHLCTSSIRLTQRRNRGCNYQ